MKLVIKMATRDYVVDVASYQSTNMTPYSMAGARQFIVKLTQSTNYFNPKARSQIKSVHANHKYLHAYHFATFGNSASRAKAEAKYFIKYAKSCNISKKRYLWLDWEAGGGNVIVNSVYSNTKAIIAFMEEVKKAGYKVGLYSGAYVLRQHVDTEKIIKKFGTCLWVASYATMGRIDRPNFNYFPSMDGVLMWQFTDNWRGFNIDASVTLKELIPKAKKSKSKAKPEAQSKAKPKKTTFICYVPILYGNPNYKVRLLDSKGHYHQYINTNTCWKVWATKTIRGMKCYKIGNDMQWVPAKFTKKI